MTEEIKKLGRVLLRLAGMLDKVTDVGDWSATLESFAAAESLRYDEVADALLKLAEAAKHLTDPDRTRLLSVHMSESYLTSAKRLHVEIERTRKAAEEAYDGLLTAEARKKNVDVRGAVREHGIGGMDLAVRYIELQEPSAELDELVAFVRGFIIGGRSRSEIDIALPNTFRYDLDALLSGPLGLKMSGLNYKLVAALNTISSIEQEDYEIRDDFTQPAHYNALTDATLESLRRDFTADIDAYTRSNLSGETAAWEAQRLYKGDPFDRLLTSRKESAEMRLNMRPREYFVGRSSELASTMFLQASALAELVEGNPRPGAMDLENRAPAASLKLGIL